MKILLIEDEPRIAEFICSDFRERGFHVDHCADGNRGFTHATTKSYDAIVCDLMLPGRDGMDVLKGIREFGIQTPVILLTARNELGDRVIGLNAGADDYLAKPFYMDELVARIQALVRRVSGVRQNTLLVGDLKLDRIERKATLGSTPIDLTSREFALLEYLMRSAGQVFTRAQILEHVWGYDFDPSTNVVDVCINRIRSKLALAHVDRSSTTLIEAVRGAGYRFKA